MGPLDVCTEDDMYAAWESGALGGVPARCSCAIR